MVAAEVDRLELGEDLSLAEVDVLDKVAAQIDRAQPSHVVQVSEGKLLDPIGT